MTQFYKIDNRRLTYREWWRITSRPTSFLYAALAKFFHIRLPFVHFGFARVEAILPLDPDQIPRSLRDRFRTMIYDCAAEGLALQFYYSVPMLGKQKGCAAAFLSQDGLIVGLLASSRAGQSAWREAFGLVSKLGNGRVLVTSGSRATLDAPPEHEVMRLPGRPVAEVLRRHHERLQAADAVPLRVEPAKLSDFVLGLSNRHTDCMIARGAYVLMTPEEVARLEGEDW